MKEHDRKAIEAFFSNVDENGVSNAEKARTRSHVIRRVESTPKDQSYEEVDPAEGNANSGLSAEAAGSAARNADSGLPTGVPGGNADDGVPTGAAEGNAGRSLPIGVVEVDGKFIGLGIHILNADVYPLQSFEIYLRDCDLVGHLDLSGCEDVVFVDLYRNRISSIDVSRMPALQGNQIAALDPTGLPACQGIDVGMNRLTAIDTSRNPELVELYVNNNRIGELDTAHNPKLKYLRCQNNLLTSLDTTGNPLLRHLYATGNPLKRILALAPGGDGASPLELSADEGGCVGLSFNPIYNAQWKETGEWEQSYHAYPDEGFAFAGWFDERGTCVSHDCDWTDEYGRSRQLTARFERE